MDNVEIIMIGNIEVIEVYCGEQLVWKKETNIENCG